MARWGVPVAFVLVLASSALLALTPPATGIDSTRQSQVSAAPGLVPHLVIYRKQAAEVVRLHDGAVTRSGDIVQVSYVAAGNNHGVVLSIDGSGAITLHHPSRPSDLSSVEPRGAHPLSYSFQLDDAPGFERFFFVTSALEPIDVEVVLRAAEMLTLGELSTLGSASLRLPESLSQSSILLRKAP